MLHPLPVDYVPLELLLQNNHLLLVHKFLQVSQETLLNLYFLLFHLLELLSFYYQNQKNNLLVSDLAVYHHLDCHLDLHLDLRLDCHLDLHLDYHFDLHLDLLFHYFPLLSGLMDYLHRFYHHFLIFLILYYFL